MKYGVRIEETVTNIHYLEVEAADEAGAIEASRVAFYAYKETMEAPPNSRMESGVSGDDTVEVTSVDGSTVEDRKKVVIYPDDEGKEG